MQTITRICFLTLTVFLCCRPTGAAADVDHRAELPVHHGRLVRLVDPEGQRQRLRCRVVTTAPHGAGHTRIRGGQGQRQERAEEGIHGSLGKGPLRLFESPPLEAGKEYSYELTARWVEGGATVERKKVVTGKPGEVVRVDLTAPDLLPIGR